MLFLILVPVNDALANVFVPLASAPYFLLLARDLRLIGYRARDAVHVYALNLALLPVNLSGVFASLRQAVSGSKSPFKRTPKVRERTGVNRSIVLGNFALLAFSLYSFVSDVMAARIVHGVFTGVTSTLLMYAIVSFMGVRASIQDLVGSRALPSARIRARAPRVLAALVGTGD